MTIPFVQWKNPPDGPLLLPAGEVHVWRIGAFADAKSALSLLDADEQKRARQFVFEKHRIRFVNAHAGRRKILARYTGQLPGQIIFSTESNGKPVLKKFPQIHFNLTHSEDIALCAVASHPVGIDIEYLTKKINYTEIAQRFFGPDDKVNSPEDFFTVWTQKEAFLKQTGAGIVNGLADKVPAGIIQSFVPAENYLAAVGPGETFLYWNQQV